MENKKEKIAAVVVTYNKKKVVALGELEEWKGLLDLFKAMETVVEHRKGCGACIIWL